MFNDNKLTTESFQIAILTATSIAFAGIAGVIAIQKKIQDNKPKYQKNSNKTIFEIGNEL